MTLEEITAQLDAALGNDAHFAAVMKSVSNLSDVDFDIAAKAVLMVPYKTRNQAMQRLNKLHASTCAMRMKEAAAN